MALGNMVPTTRSTVSGRAVSCGTFLKKKSFRKRTAPCQAAKTFRHGTHTLDLASVHLEVQSKVPGRGKGKVIKNKGDGVAAQQFNVRVGKNTSVPLTLGFTKSNELFVGRLAMLGFASACIGEVISGKGILAQLNVETGVPIGDLDGLVVGVIAFNLLAALLPASGQLVLPEDELESRPKGVLQDAKISVLEPKKFFGFSGFGFTKENELFVGRMAQLGFAAALLGEGVTGKGPLGQIGLETGIPLTEAEPLLLFSIIFTLLAAVNEGAGKFVDE